MKSWRLVIPILILAVGACESSSGSSGGEVLARAAGFEFPAQTAAEILAPQSELPNQPEVAEALADLWVQYYLLARASIQDTTLQNLDVEPLVTRQVEGQLVSELRDLVIQVDTVIPDEELRNRFVAEAPGSRVRARHILLKFPEGASQVQVDSVRALAESLRSRILEGEDFEELAREYSQDAATASRGGDLGSFGKNEMVPPFEAAAFALSEGELSQVVETTFGLHLIRVEERIVPSFEDQRDQFKTQLQNRMVMQAESTYVANLMDRAALEFDPEGMETIRQLASDPGMELSPRALGRALVRYQGGSLTLGEFRAWLLTSAPNVPPQIQAASDEQLENLLRSLTQSELLVAEAGKEGLEVPQARRDSLAGGVLTGVKEIARQLGFLDLQPMEGERMDATADRAVRDILVQIVQEGREVYPLQTVAFALKEQYGARIYPSGVDRTVELVTEIRSRPPATSPSSAPAAPPDTAVSDTAGIDEPAPVAEAPDTAGDRR